VNQNCSILKPEEGSYGQYPREDTADNSQYDDLKQKIKALEKEIAEKSKDSQITKEFHHRSEKSKTLEKNTTVHKTTVVRHEEEMGHMKKILQLMALQDKEATLQLLRLEHNLVEMQDTKKFFRFIEMVGGLDRSLNQAIDFEQMDKRTEALENFLSQLKVRKKRGDKFLEVKKLSSSRTSLDGEELESLLGGTDKPSKWRRNWFSKQNSGSLCC